VPEAISLPALHNAVESLRRKASGLSSIERRKLRCLEENLRILRDQQTSRHVELLYAQYGDAALQMQAIVRAARQIAEAMQHSNHIGSEKSQAVIARSRHLLDTRRA